MKKSDSTFITARIVASVAAILGLSCFPARVILEAQNQGKESHGKILELLIGAWERSDTMWYLGIAKNGYAEPASHAFMPLYPLLIKGASFLTPAPPIIAALLISNVALIAALRFFHELASQELKSEDAADRATALLAFFPGALFFVAGYTESLFLALSTYAILSARRGNWGRASLAACLLGLTRNIGIAITLPLLLEFVTHYRARKAKLSQLASFVVIPLGFLAWNFYCYRTTGDALIWVHQQSQWQRTTLSPFVTVWRGMVQAWDYCLSYPGGGYVYEAVAVAGTFVLGLWALLRRKLSLSLSTWIFLLIIPPLTAPFEGRMLMSCTRFVAVIFPVFIALAALVKRPLAHRTLEATFLAAYGIAVAMFVSNQYMY